MPTELKNWDLKYWTLWVGILAIAIGLTILLVYPPHDLFWKLVLGVPIEIGFAFVIAWLVSVTVERRAAKEHDDYLRKSQETISEEYVNRERDLSQRLSRSVLGYLYSVEFPRSAFEALEKYVLSKPIIKTYQRLDYELLDNEVAPGWVMMRCEFDFTLKNLSDKIVAHPIQFYASRVSGTPAPQVEGLGLQKLVIGTRHIPQAEFNGIDDKALDKPGVTNYEIVEPISPGGELRIQITFTQLKKNDDNDLWQSNSICERLDAKLRFNPEKFEVRAAPVHPAQEFDQVIGPNGTNNCIQVAMEQPLLPSNGVFFWWSPKTLPMLEPK